MFWRKTQKPEKKSGPGVVIRREQPLTWEKHDAAALYEILRLPVMAKLVAMIEDSIIADTLGEYDGEYADLKQLRAFVKGKKACLAYISGHASGVIKDDAHEMDVPALATDAIQE